MLDDRGDDEVVSTTGVELLPYFTLLSIECPADDLARARYLPKGRRLRGDGDIASDAEAFLLSLLSHSFEATATAEDAVHRSILLIVRLRREGRRDRDEGYLIGLYSGLRVLSTDEHRDRSTSQANDRTDGYLVQGVEVETRALSDLDQLRFGEGAIDHTIAVRQLDETTASSGALVEAVLLGQLGEACSRVELSHDAIGLTLDAVAQYDHTDRDARGSHLLADELDDIVAITHELRIVDCTSFGSLDEGDLLGT